MTISYLGDNYFRLQNGNDVILIDPTNARSVKAANAICFTTLPPAAEIADENTLIVGHQGEYETKGIHITGWSVGYEQGILKTIYRIAWDELTIGVLGYLEKEPDAKTLLPLSGCDIIITPAGGGAYLTAGAAAKLVRQIEPSLVIPSLYKDAKPFLKEFGESGVQPEEKITIKKKDLIPHSMKPVLLSF